ncbi:MAG TPA: TerC/Alx family metal homeostasis membrane protein [Acidobacteriaceae bacterium]|jgi:tellurite resistance protein TerC|nr:TerC/Alx family metal homeostasis membrane protein [Acidobacteriaceae bacterium]
MPHNWIAFSVVVLALLIVDLAVLQRPGRPVSMRLAWGWTAFLALLACGYALYIGHTSGRQPALEFLTGYLIEGSMSIDNLFVFLLLFRALRLGMEEQRRVLLWGVLGAIVLRGVLIVAGTTLLERFWWVQDAFGVVLAVAAVRLLLAKPGRAPVRGPIRWIQDCWLRRASGTELAFTSLLVVIAAVELTDLLFALDSIPAVLAVTRNPWIAFTSNIFAVLGLRSLYFAMAAMLDRLHLLHYGLACILGFVAFKMLAERWVTIAADTSLIVIVGILALFAILSRALPEPDANLNRGS